MRRIILLASLLYLTIASLSHAGILDDAAQNVLPPQEKSVYIEPTKGETITQQMSKQYGVTGHQFTAIELTRYIDKGNDALAQSGCLLGVNQPTTGVQAFFQKAGCEGAIKGIGIGGTFDCISCSGEWSYQGSYFRSNRGQLIGIIIKTEDGYVVEFTESMMIVTHPSLGYRMVYAIANLKFDSPDFKKYNQFWNPSSNNTTQKVEKQIKYQLKELYKNVRFKVIETTTPATINQITTYLEEQGNSVNLNTTYRVIDDIWQHKAIYESSNAIDFSKVVISQPNTTERMIKAYFKK